MGWGGAAAFLLSRFNPGSPPQHFAKLDKCKGAPIFLGKRGNSSVLALDNVEIRLNFYWKRWNHRLFSHDFLLYYSNSKKHGELDFVAKGRGNRAGRRREIYLQESAVPRKSACFKLKLI
jgi:hypothetical protein